MSGPQFIHFQSYSRKANKAGQCIEQVLGEAARAPQYSKHVADPLPPTVVYGDPIEELSKLHDEMVAAGFVDVALQDGRVARRGIRKDRHTLLTAVASHPVPVGLVEANADVRRDYEQWRSLNIAWLRKMFRDGLVSVVEHWDEAHPHIHAYILPLNDPGCSARQMNPAWRAKEEAEEAARLAGEDDRTAVKLGNAGYRECGRELQDQYYREVSVPCGLTRTGPKRRRLSRAQWKAEKDAAKREAQLLRDMDSRLGAVIKAEDRLDQSLSIKAEEISKKLDLAKRIASEAQHDRREAQVLRQQAERDARQVRDAAAKESEALRQKLAEEIRAALAKDREQLRLARACAEEEADCLRESRKQFEAEQTRLLRDAAAEAALAVLRLFLGVLDGSVRPDPAKSKWIIRNDGLREQTERSGLIGLIGKMLTAFHDAWQRITKRLSGAEQQMERERVSKPIKQALTNFREGPAP